MPLTADTQEPLLLTGDVGSTDYSFRQLRQLAQAVDGKGAMSPTDLLVTAPGGMTVSVAAGYAWVPGTAFAGPEGQHKYGVPLTGAVALGNVPAPAGGTRRDSVVLRVFDVGDDAANAGGLNRGRVEYRVNPIVSLTPEALPANAILLAYVDVTNGAAAITSGMITDRRWIVSSPVPLVAALPLNPYDGQIIDLQTAGMATDGIVWRFRYRATSASAYKWEAVTPGDWAKQVNTTEETASNVYTNLTTLGPDITLPVAGEFIIEEYVSMWSFVASITSLTSVAIGATEALDLDAIESSPNPGGVIPAINVSRKILKTIASAGQLVRMRYKSTVSTTSNFRHRTLTIKPVRVG